jgi:hypothetical protein
MFNIKGVFLVLFTIAMFSSCKEYEYIVDEPLKPFVDEYLDILKKNRIRFRKRDFKVVLSDALIGTPFAGYADGMFDSSRVYVLVHPLYWNSLSNKQKKILIFHELSHDLFDSMHTDDVFLMQPKMHSRFVAEYINWDWAVGELVKYIKDER